MNGSRAFARSVVPVHLLWIAGMAVSVLLLAVITEDASKPTASWAVLIGIPALVIALAALFPLNLAGALLVWVARNHLAAVVAAILVIATAWSAIGALLSQGEAIPNGTTTWLGVGGIAFGIAVAFRSRARG